MSSWDYYNCRAGATYDGRVPALQSTTPLAINVGIYSGNNHSGNNHTAFNGSLTRMLNWRKTDEPCTPLCRDLPIAEQAECRLASTDHYKEINTSCVGTALGFLGWQRRSYPVQYMGFFPPKFTTSSTGSTAKVAPMRIEANDAYRESGKFSDDYYLRFGGNTKPSTSRCALEDNSQVDCPEVLPLNMMHVKSYPSNDLLRFESLPNRELSLSFKIRYRNCLLYTSPSPRD